MKNNLGRSFSRLALGVAGATIALCNVGNAAEFFGTDEAFASESIYFVMTDRFVNGDTANDNSTQGQAAGQGTWDRPIGGCNGANIGYLGGDFKGIYNNADYIADMGFTSVWITPIVDNPNEAFTGGSTPSCGSGGTDKGKTGYHGYWAHNFYQVDEHWESADLSFQDFNTKMENEYGIKTVLDIVANHGSPAYTMAWDQPNFGEIYDEDWNLRADHQNLSPSNLDYNNPLHQWYNKSGGLAQLSDLNENNSEVMDYLVGAYLKWIDQGVDAFRIDTIMWMPYSFWKEFSDRIRAVHPDFYMFGEAFDYSANNISQFQKPENGGISVLDFPGKQAITSVFQDPNSDYANITWYLDLEKDIYTNPYELATFYDNHDMARMSAAGNSNAFIDANNWLFTSRGIPVVYYGSETMFMNGKSEHDGNRNYYGQSNIDNAPSSPTYANLKAIANVRKNSVALQKGVQVNGTFSGQNAYFFRVYEHAGETQTALVMLNKGNQTATFNVNSLVSSGDWVDAESGDIYTSTGSISASVDAHDVKVLLFNAPTTNADMVVRLQPVLPVVVVTPETLTAGQPVTVSYRADANQSIDLHWGVNNWEGAGSPAGDEAMTYSNGRYEVEVTLPYDINQFDFVFHNLTTDSWNNNGGADWHYSVNPDSCADCPPELPTNIAASAGDAQVSLSWSAVSLADSYNVLVTQGSQTVQTLDVTGTSVVVSNLSNDVTYGFSVQSENVNGNSDWTTPVDATPSVVVNYDSNFGTDATLHLTGIDFSNWDPANTTYQLQMVANNTWQTTVVVPAALNSSPYKLTLNGGWAVNWGGSASGLNASLARNGGDATVTLTAGTYTLTVSEGATTDAAVSVSWEQQITGDPVLAVSTPVLNLGEVTVGTQANGSVSLSNAGGGQLTIADVVENATWMSANLSGMAVNVVVDATGLTVGQSYSDSFLVQSNGGDEYVEVQFSVIDAPTDVSVTLTCNNGYTTMGQSVYAVGSIDALGNWNAANAILLDPANYPSWSAAVLIPASTAVEWKCIKRDEVDPTQSLVWQGGANNALTTPATGTANSTGSF